MSAKIKVAHVIGSLGMGGAERFLIDLVSNLPRDKVESHVFCLHQRGPRADLAESAGISVTALDLPTKIRPKGYRVVYNALRNGNFHIVHTHLSEACWYALPAAWAARVPVRISHKQNTYWHLGLKLRLFDRLSFLFGTRAIGASAAIVEFYVNRMWYPRERIELVHNGVDTGRHEDVPNRASAIKALGLDPTEFLVITVAHLQAKKGHRYLLEAAEKIVQRVPDVRFLLVGDGELRAELEEMTSRLGVESNVTFLGKRMDVPTILAASDLFVLPSVLEGFGIVLVEAGLAELPVVATEVGGIPEIIKHGQNGILVPPMDSVALAAAVIQLAGNRTLSVRLGAAGRRNAIQRFRIQTAVQRVMEIYQETLAMAAP